jgi:ABC-2 type transport system ATP-binding protein
VSTTQEISPPGEGVRVENVARAFGSVHAVRDASLSAVPGKVTALIGPNGSGKTTLLLMLASLLRPDSGSIRIAGLDPSVETGEVRAQLGWMPDVLGSWSVLTVRSALETTGRLYRMSKPRAAQRAAELIAELGLAAIADSPARVLSRGQKQKLSLARALVHDPSVLLLDEPASGLDPVARRDLQDLVRRFAAGGKTVIISSHVLAELDEMADTAVYLEAGVTVSDDRIAQTKLVARPWRIKAANPDALVGALVKHGFDRAQLVDDRGETIVPISGETAAAKLLTQLVGEHISISSFAPAVGDLEHTFLDLSRNPSEGANS